MFNPFAPTATLLTPNDRLQFKLLVFIRLSLMVAAVWALFVANWEVLGMSVLAYASTHIPTFLERRYRVLLPIEFHVIIVGFLYASLFLGEIGDAYERFWWWDTMLHVSSGVVLGFVGFLILYVLKVQQRLQMSTKLIAFFAFCVAMAGGALWEVFEYTVDLIFGTNMQRSGADTMEDLIIDAIGALIIVFATQSYLKQAHPNLLARFINNFMSLNPHLLKHKEK